MTSAPHPKDGRQPFSRIATSRVPVAVRKVRPPSPATSEAGRYGLGVLRGSAVHIGHLVGPGLLLAPALAVQAAGAASIVAWAALLAFSAPLALTFAALGVRHPVAGGVSAYVREGLGDAAAAVTGGWFLVAVLLGAPTVSLIGGYYVADLTGSGTAVASLVGLAMFVTVVAANVFGLRVSSGFQLALAAVLVVVMAIALAMALPDGGATTGRPSRRMAGGRSGRRRASSFGCSSAGRPSRNWPATSVAPQPIFRARWESPSPS